MKIEQLFRQIPSKNIFENNNIFNLSGKDSFTITAGKIDHYNSMIGSGGGFGLLFKKPVAWCCIRSDRYTLELIEKEHSYTLSYFAEEYKDQVLFLGSKSGRDSNKMQETTLTAIETPLKNVAFEEAKLIIECKLMQITTPSIDDFYTQEAKDYLSKMYLRAEDQRKYVFSEITNVWEKSI